MKKNLYETVPFKEDKLNKEAIYVNDSFKIVSLAMNQGQVLPDHKTPTEAILYCLEGEGRYGMDGEDVMLISGDYITIPANKIHQLEAKQKSRFLLIRS